MDPRARLIRIVTLLGGVYFLVYFLLPKSVLLQLGIQQNHESISNGFIVVGAMAIGLGLINLIVGHGAKIVFKRAGWSNSVALLIALVVMFFVTCAQWIGSLKSSYDIREVQLIGEFAGRIISDDQDASRRDTVPPLSQRIAALVGYGQSKVVFIRQLVESRDPSLDSQESRRALLDELRVALSEFQVGLQGLESSRVASLDAGNRAVMEDLVARATRLGGAYSALRQSDQTLTLFSRLYGVLYDGLFVQLGAAMFSLLGVYIAAAAYRAFRVKTVESALMMSAAVIVMLGQISAVFLMLHLGSFGEEAYRFLPKVRQWLLEVPNSAAFRAIRLGAGVAGLMLAIRMWLSIESKSFSSDKRG